jgi:hypothetical protein
MLAWQFGVAPRYKLPTDAASDYYFWGTIRGKVTNFDAHFMRYSVRADLLMLLALACCVLFPARRYLNRANLNKPAVLELLLLTATFIGLYIALPVGYADAWWVDVRASEMATLFLVIAFLTLPDEEAPTRHVTHSLALLIAAALVLSNLAYLTKNMSRDKAWITDYRQIVAGVPDGAKVLPINTKHLEGAVRPFLHVDSFLVIDRHGLSPYLFSGNGGYPMKYFRYVHRPYAPDDDWYNSNGAVDWQKIGCAYRYLLITKPFDASRIGVQTTMVIENSSAALLDVAVKPCKTLN